MPAKGERALTQLMPAMLAKETEMDLQYGDLFVDGVGRYPNRRVIATPNNGLVKYETVNSSGWDVWCTTAQSDFAKWAETATYKGRPDSRAAFEMTSATSPNTN